MKHAVGRIFNAFKYICISKFVFWEIVHSRVIRKTSKLIRFSGNNNYERQCLINFKYIFISKFIK